MTGAEFEGVDFDLLADYVGGALDGTPDEERVAALVASDPEWRAAFEALEPAMAAVGGALGAFDPEPMPDDLAARLDTLVRAPQADLTPGHADHSTPDSFRTPDGHLAPVTSDRADDRHTRGASDRADDRHTRGAGDSTDRRTPDSDNSDDSADDRRAAGGFRVVAHGEAGTGGAEVADSAAPAVPAKVVDLDRRRRMKRWAAPLAVAAAVVAFAGFGADWWVSSGSMNQQDSTAGAAAENSGGSTSFEVTSSNTDYSAATLLTDTPMSGTLAAGEGGSPAAVDAPAPKSGRLDRLLDTGRLMACIEAITRENSGGPIAVEIVDYARFDGEPAVIVRFSAANGLWVWAVGPECGTPGAGADTLENLPVR